MNQLLLTLVCSPSLQQTMTDWLLEQKIDSGFTTIHAFGHGHDPDKFNLIEQVEGRKKQVLFQIHMDSDSAELIIAKLSKNFNGTKIHYWLMPVIQSGHLG